MMYATLALILAYSCDPALAALFTPLHPVSGRYEVCTTPQPLDRVAPGTTAARLEPLDAFGAVGSYNRAALSRLYGGTRVRVVHRWHDFGDRYEAETLISPYPDATLTRLSTGTMIVRWVLERSGNHGRSF